MAKRWFQTDVHPKYGDIEHHPKLGKGIKVQRPSTTLVPAFKLLKDAAFWWRIHMMVSKFSQADLTELRAKICVSLLRYSSVVPSDKLFYVAGMAAKQAGHPNLAFVLLNKYMDLTEAMEEGDASGLENADMAAATAVPFSDVLPEKQYLPDEDAREEVRDWVLSVCMDSSVDQALPAEGSQVSGSTVYAGLYASDQISRSEHHGRIFYEIPYPVE